MLAIALPAMLRPLARSYQTLFYDMLFQASAVTILEDIYSFYKTHHLYYSHGLESIQVIKSPPMS
jgi:hypothetical protein